MAPVQSRVSVLAPEDGKRVRRLMSALIYLRAKHRAEQQRLEAEAEDAHSRVREIEEQLLSNSVALAAAFAAHRPVHRSRLLAALAAPSEETSKFEQNVTKPRRNAKKMATQAKWLCLLG